MVVSPCDETMKHAFLMAMLVAAVTATQAELTPSQIAKKAFPSTVLIVTQDESGQPLSIGSGFFVEKGIIATNYHVIEGASSAYARLVTEKTKYKIKWVSGIDETNDLALLEADNKTAPPMTLNPSSKDINIGESIFSVGNFKGLEGTFSSGIISGVRNLEKTKLYQITAPISPGSSGGPVLDSNDSVIGIAVAMLKSGQNLNFAVPVNYLHLLIKEGVFTTSGERVGRVIKTFDELKNKKTKSKQSSFWHGTNNKN